MDIWSWLLAHWWFSIVGYVLAFGICVAFAFRTALRGYRAERERDTDTGADDDARADADTDAEFRTDDYGVPECREHLARFGGGPTGPGSILRPCGCPYIGPPFDDCPSLLADQEAIK